MKPIFPHTMAGRKANKNTAGTHNLLLWVLSCCVLYGFASFWLSVFSLTCLPSYVPTNTWFISQFNNTNKKEQSHFNDQLYFWKKPTVTHSQLACGVSCSVKRQYRTETRLDASLCYLSTISADTTAPPATDIWTQPVSSWDKDASPFHICWRRISAGVWLNTGHTYWWLTMEFRGT